MNIYRIDYIDISFFFLFMLEIEECRYPPEISISPIRVFKFLL